MGIKRRDNVKKENKEGGKRTSLEIRKEMRKINRWRIKNKKKKKKRQGKVDIKFCKKICKIFVGSLVNHSVRGDFSLGALR